MIQAKDGIHSYELIAKDTYRIDEKGIVNCYLLLGENSALLIDCGVGVGDIAATISEITFSPNITVTLTHRHCDHAGGCDFFKSYYVHEGDDKKIYKILSSKFASKLLLKKNDVKGLRLSKKPYHSILMPFKDDKTFDLGGRTITAVHVPGHTQGSVVYLDPKTHLMFTGDDVNPYLWLQLPGCTSLSEWLPGAEAILKLADTYTPYCGHSNGLIKKEDIAKLIALAKEILEKKPEFKGKALDYPEDKTVFPRLIVARKGIK